MMFNVWLAILITTGLYFINIGEVTGQSSLKILPFSFPTSVLGKRSFATCATSTGEKVDFRWIKNGKDIAKHNNVNVRSYPDLSTLVIDPLTEDDSGNYTCVVSSRGITSSYTTTLDVLVPPAWKIMPTDIDAVSGDNVILNCQGSGQPQPVVQWHRTIGINPDFFPVTNHVQANGSMILNDISKEDEGITFIHYILMLILQNTTCGQATLIIQPFNFPAESVIGRRVSATCTPSAGEKMEFKWFRNGKELSKGINIDIRSFSDLSNLVIDPLTEEDTGNYTCVINSRGMTASYTTTLEVLVPPSWSYIPTDIDALNGDPVTLQCKGSGTPKPSITWLKAQGENADFTPISNSNNPSILLNGSLYFDSIDKKDEGLYKCNISNGIGTSLLKSVIVRVIVFSDNALQIQPFFFPSKSIIGKRASVTCTPTVGEKMSFNWFKNGKELMKGMNIDIRSFSDLSTLVIDPLTEDDSGNYTCMANSRSMTASYTTVLEVLIPPSWSHVPNDIDALSGDSVTLNCLGLAIPKPTISWSRTQGESEEYISLSSLSSSTISPNGSFHISSIDKDDEGMYKCNVSNGIGSSLTKVIVIRVIEGNSIKIQPFSFPSDSAIGKRASVTCSPLTGEKIEFKWLKNGKEIGNGRHNIHIATLSLISSLIIDPLKSDDNGNYTCVVNSRGMSGSFTTSLEVMVPPSWNKVPSDTDASSGDSLMMNCNGIGRPEPTVIWTKLHGETTSSAFVSVSNQATLFPNGSFYIENISKEDEGMYQCNVSNGIGNSLIKTIMIKVIGML
ncbi:hemicentin-1 [Trichonephila clavata]|uniref:Hemicentin-1 n=1 Tax=Trichonephila clavata TaxID=2740835 RepID=A0A8X6GKR3_TRICU|nr:hemicentin-1 [Trichonephila clavata]